MAGSFLTFTDAIGAAQLDNGMTAIASGVGSRFVNWLSMSKPIGPAKTALGTGARAMFTFRTDYLASFEVQDIPNANQSIIDRLIAWLLLGGTVSVTTGDATANVYATCGLAEGATPSKRLFNRNDLTWSLSVTLVNLAGTPVPMYCIYPN
jgi:hypothetical protein